MRAYLLHWQLTGNYPMKDVFFHPQQLFIAYISWEKEERKQPHIPRESCGPPSSFMRQCQQAGSVFCGSHAGNHSYSDFKITMVMSLEEDSTVLYTAIYTVVLYKGQRSDECRKDVKEIANLLKFLKILIAL